MLAATRSLGSEAATPAVQASIVDYADALHAISGSTALPEESVWSNWLDHAGTLSPRSVGQELAMACVAIAMCELDAARAGLKLGMRHAELKRQGLRFLGRSADMAVRQGKEVRDGFDPAGVKAAYHALRKAAGWMHAAADAAHQGKGKHQPPAGLHPEVLLATRSLFTAAGLVCAAWLAWDGAKPAGVPGRVLMAAAQEYYCVYLRLGGAELHPKAWQAHWEVPVPSSDQAQHLYTGPLRPRRNFAGDDDEAADGELVQAAQLVGGLASSRLVEHCVAWDQLWSTPAQPIAHRPGLESDMKFAGAERAVLRAAPNHVRHTAAASAALCRGLAHRFMASQAHQEYDRAMSGSDSSAIHTAVQRVQAGHAHAAAAAAWLSSAATLWGEPGGAVEDTPVAREAYRALSQRDALASELVEIHMKQPQLSACEFVPPAWLGPCIAHVWPNEQAAVEAQGQDAGKGADIAEAAQPCQVGQKRRRETSE